jgi:hypothetical protein
MIYRKPSFLQSSDSAPCPPPSSLSVSKLSSCLSFSVFLCVASRACWLRGRGWARSPILRPRESLWPSINHSMLSDVTSSHCSGNFYEQRVTIGRSSHSADSETTPSRSGAGNRRQFDADPARLVFRPVLPTLSKIFRPGATQLSANVTYTLTEFQEWQNTTAVVTDYRGSALIKKQIKFSSYMRKFTMEQLQLQRHIWLTASPYMVKYLRISSYIRKPSLIYDFATAPFWITLYMRKIRFSFLSQCSSFCFLWETVQEVACRIILEFFCFFGRNIDELATPMQATRTTVSRPQPPEPKSAPRRNCYHPLTHHCKQYSIYVILKKDLANPHS